MSAAAAVRGGRGRGGVRVAGPGIEFEVIGIRFWGAPRQDYTVGFQPHHGGGIDHLRRTLSAGDRRQLLADLPSAPVWLHPHLRAIAAQESP